MNFTGKQMRRTTRAMILILLFAGNTAQATRFIACKGSDSVIDTEFVDDVFLEGNTIRLDGKVRGDLYVACNELVLSDSVSGNLSTACKSIQILGPIGRSFLGFAYSVACNAPVERNFVAFARYIVIGPEVTIGLDASLFSETVVFQGNVAGDLKINADRGAVSGRVEGDLNFKGNVLTISSDAVINGDLIYCSPEKADLEGTVIKGEIKWTQCVVEDKEETSATKMLGWLVSHRGYFLFLTIYSLLMFIVSAIPFPNILVIIGLSVTLLLSGNLFILFTKSLCSRTEKVLNKRTFPSMGVGFAIILLSPFLTLVLLLSIFGAPLGAVVILIFGVACFAGFIYASLFLGRKICLLLRIGSKSSAGYGCYSLGVVILVILTSMPVVGYILSLLVTMLGLGGLTLAIYGEKTNISV